MLTFTGVCSLILLGLLASPLLYIWLFETTAVLSAVALVILLTLFSEEPFVPDMELIKMQRELKEMEDE